MSYAETLIPPQPAPREVRKPMTAARLSGSSLVTLRARRAARRLDTAVNGWEPDKFTR